jgi:hypothetical protein
VPVSLPAGEPDTKVRAVPANAGDDASPSAITAAASEERFFIIISFFAGEII